MFEPKSTQPILVVDDDRTFRHVLQSTLREDGFNVELASSVSSCVAKLKKTSPQLVLLDLNLPDGDGIDVLKRVRAANSNLPIVLITAAGDSDSAIDASRFGARDYLTKPLDLRKLREVVERILTAETRAHDGKQNDRRLVPTACRDEFIGPSRAMQEVFKAIGRVAQTNVSVLTMGESGTGKELVARAIWQHSDRADKTFMAVNCAALSGELLESELFGHEKGAFTGANQRHIGKFEACNGGTLFLDEVGDMPLAMQAKLLRVLQERRFVRVGGDETIETDARIIAATNCDLQQLAAKNQFREDLYHRLNGFTVNVPPLRDRDNDVRTLLQHLLHRYNEKLNKRIESISAAAMELLVRYRWPGNVRELESVLSQMMLNAQTPVLDVVDVPHTITHQRKHQLRPKSSCASERNSNEAGQFEEFVSALLESESEDIHAAMVEFCERYLLQRILEQTDGNQSAAARRLGITRGSLRFKIQNLGISIDSKIKLPAGHS